MNYSIKKTFDEALKFAGVDFTVWYRTSTSVYSGGGVSGVGIPDPFYGTNTDYNYSTAYVESGRVWKSTPYVVRGILNQFSKGINYIEDGNYKFGVNSYGMGRATLWLDNCLVNIHSVTGPTYFTDSHTVECMGNLYKTKNETRVGPGEERFLIVLFDKI